jgi:protein TonB
VRWLLLSLALHLLLLLWLIDAEQPTLTWQSLNVVLVEQQVDGMPRNDKGGKQQDSAIEHTHQQGSVAETAPTAAMPPRPMANPVPAAKEPGVAQSKTTEAASQPPQQTTVAQASPQAIENNQQDMQRRLKARIQLALARHFRYPSMAKRRGWQGEVILAFRLQSDGSIISARIAHSSGYSVLDQAALHALGKVKRLKHTMQDELDMQLPVIYRLEG